MKVDEILAVARDSMTVRRVYAEPVERDGVTVIAAASVTGGGGAGSGIEQGKEGSGGGFGLGAKPVGAYVIKDGRVTLAPGDRPQPANHRNWRGHAGGNRRGVAHRSEGHRFRPQLSAYEARWLRPCGFAQLTEVFAG